MLRIRKEQMEILSEAMRTSFVRRVVARLQRDFAAALDRGNLHEANLMRTLEHTITRAAGYGVCNEQDVECFIDCTMLLGLEFDRDSRFPWAASLLQRSDLTGTEKMALIHDHLLFTIM